MPMHTLEIERNRELLTAIILIIAFCHSKWNTETTFHLWNDEEAP